MNWSRLYARWQSLSTGVRAAIGVAALVVIGGGIFLGIVTQRPRVSLFAGPLHPEQLSEVEERLAGWSVAFTPTADNLVVDAGSRSDLLLRLSLAGVPHAHVSGSGEALATISALTPQTVIDAQARAGLAGDIELGLRGMNGIDDAQVIVAAAKVAEFADDTARGASASVRLHMHGQARLSPDAVQGIRQFVAASVAGLDSNRVTIVDDSGLALDAQPATGGDAAALQTSLQSALDQAFGPGAAIVRLHTEQDARTQETHEVRRAPLGALAANGTDETYRGEGKSYRRSERSEDRGSETREVSTAVPAGNTIRLSAAIFVDARRGLDIEKIRALAAATVGIDPRRGDTLSVEAVDFAHEQAVEHDGWWLAYGALVPLLPNVALTIGALCVLRFAGPPLFGALRALVERAAIAQTKEAVRGFAPSQVAGALRNEPPHAAAAIISALPASTAAAVLDMYPPHERTAIVRRMQRAHSPLIPDAREVIEHA